MELTSIAIISFSYGCLHMDCDGMRHVKSLPCLSVVQSVEGSYDIALGEGPEYSTGEGGMFIAPADVMQQITHRNGTGGKMRARWAFLDVIINGCYSLDDLYEFPTVMPAGKWALAGELIAALEDSNPICERYSAAYRLVGLLMDVGSPRHAPDDTQLKIRRFVAEHHAERIGAQEIAEAIHCSPSQVFRYTRRYFGASPANYINSIRLSHAAGMLELTRKSVGEVAASVGFDDISYFSRLFRKAFGMPPGSYRQFRSGTGK